jgi:hypothetical protein
MLCSFEVGTEFFKYNLYELQLQRVINSSNPMGTGGLGNFHN